MVYNQSITGLAYRDGKLYGSTSIKGGLGITPTETEAKLFIWDVAGKQKLLERTLNLPGHQPNMIGSLAFGPDGLLWGATGSAIFALDPSTLDIVKSRTLYSPKLDNSGNGRPYDLIFGDDGYIYSTIGLSVTIIDPNTLEFDQLAPKADMIALDLDGSVFYSLSGKDMYRLPVKLQTVTIATYEPVLTLNSTAALGLEGLLANGKAANLATATITYVTSDPQVVTVDVYGHVTAHAPGEANIHVKVTLDGKTVLSDPVRIQVVATVPAITAALADYRLSGLMEESLYYQLDNSLRQADHHREKGEKNKADHFIQKFIDDLPSLHHGGTEADTARLLILTAISDLRRQWGLGS